MTSTNTELYSTVMDDEHTQAAEPVLEHTAPAPTEDATQNIYAWSQANYNDDTEPAATPHHRSWKLPVALTALAATGAITAAVLMAWPHARPAAQVMTGPTPPTAASTPSTHAPPTDPDARFIDLLQRLGHQTSNPQAAIRYGHQVCTDRNNGIPETTIATDMVAANPITPAAAQQFIDTATDTLCPQYSRH